MPRAEVTLPGATSSVPTARHFAESVLTSWGEADVAWSAALCVSELAGNCALHARTTFTVAVELQGEAVRIEVRDGSPRVPAQRSYDTGSTTGRGLRLVGEYASSWGVERTESGKTVWVLLDARPAPAGRDREDEEASVDVLLAAFADEGDEQVGDGRVHLSWPAAA
jgi:anti-sigma regulatory factor (Ser/Thr protein kinase)